MPEAVTSAGWFPVATAFAGYAAGFVTEWFRDSRTARREREARAEKRADDLRARRAEFQRQTLLDLQEAMFQLARAAGTLYHQDVMTFRKTGVWGRQLVSDEVSEGHRAALARTDMLVARVRDEDIRHLVGQLRTRSGEVSTSRSEADAEGNIAAMMAAQEQANQRIGEVLRSLDELAMPASRNA
jgi:hypothetical protein